MNVAEKAELERLWKYIDAKIALHPSMKIPEGRERDTCWLARQLGQRANTDPNLQWYVTLFQINRLERQRVQA
jgi:hypothetical protein